MGYAGVLLGPAALGFVAKATSLPMAFGLLVALQMVPADEDQPAATGQRGRVQGQPAASLRLQLEVGRVEGQPHRHAVGVGGVERADHGLFDLGAGKTVGGGGQGVE